MTRKDYRIAYKFLKIRATRQGCIAPFEATINLPEAQCNRIYKFLIYNHQVKFIWKEELRSFFCRIYTSHSSILAFKHPIASATVWQYLNHLTEQFPMNFVLHGVIWSLSFCCLLFIVSTSFTVRAFFKLATFENRMLRITKSYFCHPSSPFPGIVAPGVRLPVLCGSTSGCRCRWAFEWSHRTSSYFAFIFHSALFRRF